MSEKLKKKPALSIAIKRWTDQRAADDLTSPKTPVTSLGGPQFNQNGPNKNGNSEPKPRKLSAGGIKDLVQCCLCLEVLHNPKMLPCQHTFCMACLSVYIADNPVFDCPICRTRIQITGPNFVNDLPSNLYIDSLLQLMGVNGESKSASPIATPSPITPNGSSPQNVELFASGVRCSQCKTMCDASDTSSCGHCKMKFCGLCWSQHLDDLRTQIESILKQLDSAAGRLEHKIEHYKDRCERISEQIKFAADEKIHAIIEAKEDLLKEALDLQKSGDMNALALKSSLEEARVVAAKATGNKDLRSPQQQVTTFVNLHQNALQILTDISKWDVENFVFDKENFRIEQDSVTTCDAESDDPLPISAKQKEPLESEDSLMLHYRTRNFIPHYVWRKTSRPCGVGIGPWDNNLYVCAADSHCVLVVERAQAKIVARLACEEMLCPANIAFMKSIGEIYITDKWKHCLHVFSKDGEYVRSVGQKGSRPGSFRSPEGIATDNAHNLIYVVDTGNDRVQVIQPDGKFVDQIGVATKMQAIHTASMWETQEVTCTELNSPTSVAVTNDRIVVLDSGNRRVKVYHKHDKSKIAEFGSLGQRKGQFRQPEVLAVDPMGFILVGDSGNCRIQVFKPNGQLVRVFGGMGTEPGKFGWISGIHVTKQLDIIVSDTKSRCVSFF